MSCAKSENGTWFSMSSVDKTWPDFNYFSVQKQVREEKKRKTIRTKRKAWIRADQNRTEKKRADNRKNWNNTSQGQQHKPTRKIRSNPAHGGISPVLECRLALWKPSSASHHLAIHNRCNCEDKPHEPKLLGK